MRGEWGVFGEVHIFWVHIFTTCVALVVVFVFLCTMYLCLVCAVYMYAQTIHVWTNHMLIPPPITQQYTHTDHAAAGKGDAAGAISGGLDGEELDLAGGWGDEDLGLDGDGGMDENGMVDAEEGEEGEEDDEDGGWEMEVCLLLLVVVDMHRVGCFHGFHRHPTCAYYLHTPKTHMQHRIWNSHQKHWPPLQASQRTLYLLPPPPALPHSSDGVNDVNWQPTKQQRGHLIPACVC